MHAAACRVGALRMAWYTPAQNWWDGMDLRRRTGLSIGVVLILVIVAALGWFSLHAEFVALSAGMSREDTAAVVAELEDRHIRYKLDATSGALLVPSCEADSIRAQLVQKGLRLKPTPGFELFDNGDFGMTDFTERINYQRALEGELARTIMALDYVRFCRVHLVLPQGGLFKRAAESPKASVVLIARRGETVSGAQIAGVQRMVASAVPDLKPESVSVHDRSGVELTGGESGSLSPGAVDSELRAQSNVEEFLSAKGEEVLARIFPQGAATVSVSATLSRSRVSSSRDEILPSGQGSGAVSRIKSDTLPEGAKGLLPHLGPEPTPSKPDGGPKFDVEYRIGHLSEQSESAPGAIERLSVGAVIPDPAAYGMTLDGVRDLLAVAIGIDPSRGDRIAVYSVALKLDQKITSAGSAPVEAAVPAAPMPSHRSPWPLLVGAALFLAALAIWLGGRQSGRNMSPAEREQLLRELKEWLR